MEVLDELEFREDVGVLVLTGEGTAWSAGMDLKEYFRETEAQGLAGTRKAQRESLWLVAPAALVPEADHRHGQRLVLRRRLRPAVRLRSGLRGGGGTVRPVARSTGASCRAAARPRSPRELMSFRDAMYHAMTGETHRRQEGRGMEAGQRGGAAGASCKARVDRGRAGAAEEESGGAEGDQGRHAPRRAR